MTTERNSPWMQSYLGGRLYPSDPRPEDFEILDIAHSLAHQCRWGGHCSRFYSVAQHSVLVSEQVPKELALQALMHDAAESVLVDMPRPAKVSLSGYAGMESKIMDCLSRRFGFAWPPHEKVVEADEALLATEAAQLLEGGPNSDWDFPWKKLQLRLLIVPLLPKQARALFLRRFEMVGGKIL